jgi:TP901 family phage tail tape measure protein
MANNLGYIARELGRVQEEARNATIEVGKLEAQIRKTIALSATGLAGGPAATPQQGRVREISKNVLNDPTYIPAGRPLGASTVTSSGITPALEELKRQYISQLITLKALDIQQQNLATALNAQTIAANQAASSTGQLSEAEQQLNAASKAAAQAARQQPASADKTITERYKAWAEESLAAKKLADAERKAADAASKVADQQIKLGGLVRGETVPASSLASAGGGGGGGKQQQPVYTQATIQKLFPPQAAQNILQTAKGAGFEPEDIKRVTEYANAYTQLQFEAKTADGVLRKLVLTTDRAGNVFTSTQKQFRTFFSSIRRNIGEMVKWSAATLLVWGSIRKLSELLQIAIDNESKLASIAVILGEEHTNLTNVFNAAAEAADATGTSIDGVLEGYVQAYRATGNIADQTERAAQAQELLTSALTLSKLSTLSTAQAMDVLSGALRQAGLDFDEGAVLLDKWVAVSRVANVGIETLAESFAITATSASNAGLSWDELNGIIATLAESTTLSATESGNAIRAFISGFTTDTAVKELTKYGIAVTDSTGETRNFLSVMQEISALFEQGVITESELNRISRAIGGGARREAQVATTIKNLGRAQEVAAISAAANGDAQRALAVQLDTVQTALTKLNNAFQKLARAMGSEGGVLEAAGGVLNIFTKLVDATSALVKNLGDMTPILAGLGLLFAATSAESRGLLTTNIAGGVGRLLGQGGALSQNAIQNARLQNIGQGGIGAVNMSGLGGGGTAANWLLQPGIGRNAGSRLGQGLGAGFTLFSAARDLQQDNQAGAAGSIVGGIIGGLLSGGQPIGIVIGTAAGEAFANATFNYKADFSRFFTDIFEESTEDVKDGGVSNQTAATEAVFKEYGEGNAAQGRLKATLNAAVANFIYGTAAYLGTVDETASVSPEQFALTGTTIFGGGVGNAQAAGVFDLQSRQNALLGFDAEPQGGTFQFAVVDRQENLLKKYEGVLSEIEKVQADAFRKAATKGDISDKELRDALESIPALQSALTKYEAVFGDELRRVNSDITDVTDSFEYWTNIVVNGSTEQLAWLNAVAQEVAAIENAIEDAARAGTPGQVLLTLDDPETKEDETEYVSTEVARQRQREKIEGALVSSALQTSEIAKERIVIPTTVDLGLSEEDFPAFLAEMQRLQDAAFEGWWEEGLNADFSAEEIASTFAPFFLALGQDGAGKYLEGFEQGFAQEAFENLVNAGEITPIEDKSRPRGLQSFDISSGELPAVMARYQELVNITGQAGYVPDEETFAALFTDYIAMPITADLTLLNIAMQELIDVNKKELDGIYNLPTDASFYVPFTGYQLGFVNQGGGGGTGLAGLGAGNQPEGEATGAGAPDIDRTGRPRVRGRYRVPINKRIQETVDEIVQESIATPRADLSQYNEARKAQALAGGPEFNRADLRNYFPPKGDKDMLGINAGAGGDVINMLRDLINSLFGLNGEDSTITTKLQIESTTNTIVQLDGQVIANAIKPYLLNDEVRYEGTAGSAVKRFVI